MFDLARQSSRAPGRAALCYVMRSCHTVSVVLPARYFLRDAVQAQYSSAGVYMIPSLIAEIIVVDYLVVKGVDYIGIRNLCAFDIYIMPQFIPQIFQALSLLFTAALKNLSDISKYFTNETVYISFGSALL